MRLLERFHNTRFRTKLIVSYIFVALVPLIVFTIIGNGIMIAQAERIAYRYTEQMVTQIGGIIDLYIGSIDRIADMLSQGVSRLTADKGAWEEQSQALTQILEDLDQAHPEIAGIIVALPDNRYASAGITRPTAKSVSGEAWYRRASSCPGELVLVANFGEMEGDPDCASGIYVLAKAIADPDSGQVECVVMFEFCQDIILNSIDNAQIGSSSLIFILDNDEQVIYRPASNPDILSGFDWATKASSSEESIQIEEEEFYIRWNTSEYSGWKTVGVFQKYELMAGMRSMLKTMLVLSCFTALFVTLTSLWLSSYVTRPLLKLRRLMRKAESGDLSARFNALYRDEIGDLGKSYNHMLDEIESLLGQVYEEQQEKRDVQIKMLQEQIKPHFLYNTLDTISWMAREYEAQDIVQLVDALTTMFRVGLSQGKDIITLKEEITHISSYMYIQTIRYQSKLRYMINVDPAADGCLVPKLILQPLVENAIYHGIKPKQGAGTIEIRGIMADEMVILSVKDDGVGMDEETLAAIRQRFSGEKRTAGSSFGLYYIAQRMQLFYKGNYNITIDSTQGEGTTVTLSLQARLLADAKEE